MDVATLGINDVIGLFIEKKTPIVLVRSRNRIIGVITREVAITKLLR